MAETHGAISRALTHKPSLFARLGLHDVLTPLDELREAYRSAALLIHPDKCKHPQAKNAFQRLSEAYDELAKPGRQEKLLEQGGGLLPEEEEALSGGGRKWWDVGWSQFEVRLRQKEADAAHLEAIKAAAAEGDDTLAAYMASMQAEQRRTVGMGSASSRGGLAGAGIHVPPMAARGVKRSFPGDTPAVQPGVSGSWPTGWRRPPFQAQAAAAQLWGASPAPAFQDFGGLGVGGFQDFGGLGVGLLGCQAQPLQTHPFQAQPHFADQHQLTTMPGMDHLNPLMWSQFATGAATPVETVAAPASFPPSGPSTATAALDHLPSMIRSWTEALGAG